MPLPALAAAAVLVLGADAAGHPAPSVPPAPVASIAGSPADVAPPGFATSQPGSDATAARPAQPDDGAGGTPPDSTPPDSTPPDSTPPDSTPGEDPPESGPNAEDPIRNRPELPAAPPGAGEPAPGAGYAWPLLPAPAVLTPFRAPAHSYGPGHRGVDLAGTAGQPVLAARAGAVVFAGTVAGRPLVSVQHDDGLRTTYEPVAPAVVAGAVVAAGAVLGRLEPGHPGCVRARSPPATCLHWGVRRDRTDYLDPLVLLRPPRVRLLPVPDPWPDRPDRSVPANGSGRTRRRVTPICPAPVPVP